MIKDESMGLVIAETPEEAFYEKIIQNTTKDIENYKEALKFAQDVKEMAENKLKCLNLETSKNKEH